LYLIAIVGGRKKNPDLDDAQMVKLMKGLRRKGFKVIYLPGRRAVAGRHMCAEAAGYLTCDDLHQRHIGMPR